MIIGIDASALTLPNPTGVQRYTEYIIKHLLEIRGEHTIRLYTPRALPEPFTPYQKIISSPRFWTQIRLPIELFFHKPDVFFQPSYMLPPYMPCRAVTTVHDLAWCLYPHAYSETQLRLLETSITRIKRYHAHVIVPSNSAKKDAIELLRLPVKTITHIPEALIELPQASEEFEVVNEHKDKHIVLAVSRLEERKNTVTLVKAIEALHSRNEQRDKKIVLVLVGQAGYGAEKVFEAITHARKNGVEVIHRKDASDQELAAWFKHAALFVYPSLYEGFGLPILQAFATHVPVITTHVSSLPEVAGDAAQYIQDPHSEEELAAAINSILFDTKKAQKLIELGKTQLETFSWEKAAKQTLHVLTDM